MYTCCCPLDSSLPALFVCRCSRSTPVLSAQSETRGSFEYGGGGGVMVDDEEVVQFNEDRFPLGCGNHSVLFIMNNVTIIISKYGTCNTDLYRTYSCRLPRKRSSQRFFLRFREARCTVD